MTDIRPKPVYVGDHHFGEAPTWEGVNAILRDHGVTLPAGRPHPSMHGFEGPDGFFLPASFLQRRTCS